MHEQEDYERAHGVQAPGGGGYRPPAVGGEPYAAAGFPPQQYASAGGVAGYPVAAGGAQLPAAPSQVRCCGVAAVGR